MIGGRPPAVARLLLALFLPEDARVALVAELEEEYVRDVRPSRGAVRARVWYWRQAIGSAAPAIQMRRRRRRMTAHLNHSHQRRARRWIEQALSDARFGLRHLRKRPGFATAAIAIIALGIGANTAIFTLVDAVVLKQLPYRDADRLVRIWSANPRGIPRNSISPADFFDFRDQARGPHAFESLAAFTLAESTTLRGHGEPARVLTSTVSPELFQVLGVPPAAGRWLGASDSDSAGPRGVVISSRLWRSRFGASPTALGQSITLDASPFTIAGVMPESFAFPTLDVEAWIPLPDSERNRSRSAHFLDAVGRLGPTVSDETAKNVLETIAARLAAQYPDTNRGWGITTTRLHQSIIGDVRRPLLVLLAAVGCVLLIACANVSSLLLARGVARARELAVRTALGASRGRVVRQQLVESGLLAAIGGASGVAIASLVLRTLRASSSLDIPRLQEVDLDLRVLAVSAALTILSGLITGMLPAMRTAQANPGQTLKGGRSDIEPVTRRFRSILVTAQIALSTTLVIVAGLLMATFSSLTSVDAGFKADRVLLAHVSLTVTKYDPLVWSSFFERALDEIRSLPGVVAAGAGAPLPLSGQQGLMRFGVRFEGRPEPLPGDFDRIYLRRATPGYFNAMGIPLLDGRVFEASDRADTKPIAVVDRTFAERYFPAQNPIGRKVRSTNDRTFREIVGVVGAVRQTTLHQAAEPHLYVAQAQNPLPGMTFAIRTSVAPEALVPSVREAVRRIDPREPVFNVRTLEDVLSGSVASQRLNALLIALFAYLALALSLVGVYGLIAGWVTESTKEIGVRIALGAGQAGIYALVFTRGLRLTLAGVVFGIALALAATRSLQGMLYGTAAWDPGIFISAAAFVLASSVLATWLPARRALGIDPATALRDN